MIRVRGWVIHYKKLKQQLRNEQKCDENLVAKLFLVPFGAYHYVSVNASSAPVNLSLFTKFGGVSFLIAFIFLLNTHKHTHTHHQFDNKAIILFPRDSKKASVS